MINKASKKLAIGRKMKCYILVIWFVLVLSKTSQAALPLCTSGLSVVITSSCRFTPGENKYTSLDIRSDVFLDTSSNNAVHTFIISGDFTLRSGVVLSVGYNQESNTGAAPGNSGGSHGGRGGAESGTTLEANEGVPYGSSLVVNTPGSKGGNGGQGGGLLKIQASGITIDGSIRTNGEHGHRDRKSGGGSGGGVAIQCITLAGVGDVDVRGGLGQNNGGGGSGGRISVNCTNDAFSGTFQVQGGKTGTNIRTPDEKWVSPNGSILSKHRSFYINKARSKITKILSYSLTGTGKGKKSSTKNSFRFVSVFS